MTSVVIFDPKAEFYAAELAKAVPELTYHAATSPEGALEHAAGASVLIGIAPDLKPDLIGAISGLEWIQALTTGVDNLLVLDDIAITNCHGIHGPQMAEMGVLLMLACARRFPEMVVNQSNNHWARWRQPMLIDKTVCMLGVGAIAEHLAHVLAGFSMRITGVSNGRGEVPGFDRIYPRAQLHEATAEADFVVVLSPYSPENHHIVDADLLATMKPTAHVINLSRGGCVDEDALSDALREGRIATSATDVFKTEPLPADSPLWQVPNLILTPHVGGYSDRYHEQALPTVIKNMKAYAAGGVAALEGRCDQ